MSWETHFFWLVETTIRSEHNQSRILKHQRIWWDSIRNGFGNNLDFQGRRKFFRKWGWVWDLGGWHLIRGWNKNLKEVGSGWEIILVLGIWYWVRIEEEEIEGDKKLQLEGEFLWWSCEGDNYLIRTCMVVYASIVWNVGCMIWGIKLVLPFIIKLFGNPFFILLICLFWRYKILK